MNPKLSVSPKGLHLPPNVTAEEFKAAMEKAFPTGGQYDGMPIAQVPDDATAEAIGLLR